ncbi:DUF4350 domain-containing protein [Microbacterium sp.]|uniref:DUF4350 domain-containing protein n=1 Tax=Microbacterium sp. TaxID=51671 RepID=UPI0033416D87
MTSTTPDTGEAVIETPSTTAAARQRGRWRRALGWVLIVLLACGGAAVAARMVATAPTATGVLSPEGTNDVGAKALAELVRQQGVEVITTRSRSEAAAAITDDTTLVLSDPYQLTDEGVRSLLDSADRVVLLSSSSRTLRLLGLGTNASSAGGAVEPGCAIPEFAKVGKIVPTRVFAPDASADACFVDEEGNAAVLRGEPGGPTVTIVEGTALFTNAHVAENGNAALGLALLAQTGRVVWYEPTLADTDRTGEEPDTLGTRTPDWLTPAIVMLLLAGVAATLWRGRRFGPLVAENLPVTVRASETMHGRARLTAKAADAGHAAAEIRDGTVRRLAKRLGLSDRAAPHEVADAAADRLRIPRGSLHDLLGGDLPASDVDLVDTARRLAELEAAVDSTMRSAGNAPTERNTP